MNDLESRLKTLALRKPPNELKRRIFADTPSVSLFQRGMQPVPFRWAMAFSLLMALLGYALAYSLHSTSSGFDPSPKQVFEIRLIEQPVVPDVFDLSAPSQPFLTGNVTCDIETKLEI